MSVLSHETLSKGELITIITALERYARAMPHVGGPSTNDEFRAIARVSKKVALALEKYGVNSIPRTIRLEDGTLTILVPEAGGSFDVRA